MSKVICDICGTSYPETAEQCPICGYTRDLGAILGDEIEMDQTPAAPAAAPVKGGKFSASNVRKRNKSTPPYQVQPAGDPEEEDDEFEYDDERRESNALLVVLLVVVITALLAVTGYIALKYLVPNVLPEETTEPTVMTEPSTEITEETQAPTVPCTNLVLTSGGTVELEQEGQYWLLNVVVLPVDSTDVLTYESSDETVATVNSEGRVTAVSTGEAVITIRCGEQALECRVICNIPEETFEPEQTDDASEANEGEDNPDEETT